MKSLPKINKTILSMLIIGLSIIIGLSVVLNNKEEKCFVSEMSKWKETNSIETEIGGITQKDEKMAVAKARTLIHEWKYEDIKDTEAKKVFLMIITIFDYCGIES